MRVDAYASRGNRNAKSCGSCYMSKISLLCLNLRVAEPLTSIGTCSARARSGCTLPNGQSHLSLQTLARISCRCSSSDASEISSGHSISYTQIGNSADPIIGIPDAQMPLVAHNGTGRTVEVACSFLNYVYSRPTPHAWLQNDSHGLLFISCPRLVAAMNAANLKCSEQMRQTQSYLGCLPGNAVARERYTANRFSTYSKMSRC